MMTTQYEVVQAKAYINTSKREGANLAKSALLYVSIYLARMSLRTADNSLGSSARKDIRSFERGCSKLSFHECRKTLSSLKSDGFDGA